METLVSGGGAQVTTSLRDFVEAAHPEAVARRRAEELKALATSELHELAPGGGTHPALVQVGCAPWLTPSPQLAWVTRRRAPVVTV